MKIVFDEPLPAEKVIGPGLSVSPSVQTGPVALPRWACACLAVVLTIGLAVIVRWYLGRSKAAATV